MHYRCGASLLSARAFINDSIAVSLNSAFSSFLELHGSLSDLPIQADFRSGFSMVDFWKKI
jgi:hypothetical protein